MPEDTCSALQRAGALLSHAIPVFGLPDVLSSYMHLFIVRFDVVNHPVVGVDWAVYKYA